MSGYLDDFIEMLNITRLVDARSDFKHLYILPMFTENVAFDNAKVEEV